jgi:hypothetical protein
MSVALMVLLLLSQGCTVLVMSVAGWLWIEKDYKEVSYGQVLEHLKKSCFVWVKVLLNVTSH